MHSLLRISDLVETYHASLHDFLQDKKRAGEFFLDPEIISTRYMKPIETLKQFTMPHAIHDSPARNPLPKCHPGTRERILRIIINWVDEDDVTVPVLWLSGPPGSGKSAIAQTVAEQCSKDEKLAASYFFQRTKIDYDTADPLFRTLAWQLVYSIPETATYIASAMKADPLLPTKSFEIQLENLIVQPLKKALGGRRPKKSVVIIDGIGECGDKRAQRRILKLIVTALSCGLPLRFLISSRRISHISETLLDSKFICRLVTLEDGSDSKDDVRRYLQDEAIRTLQPDDYVTFLLATRSRGHFLYAASIIKFIDAVCEDPRMAASFRLDEYLMHRGAISHPKTHWEDIISLPVEDAPFTTLLDRLYKDILSRSSDYDSTMMILRHVASLPRPSVRLLSWRLGTGDANLYVKLRKLRPLLRVSSDSIVEAYHICFLEFLGDKKRSGKYYVSPWETTVGVTRLAIAYFAYSQLPLVE